MNLITTIGYKSKDVGNLGGGHKKPCKNPRSQKWPFYEAKQVNFLVP